MRTSLALGTAVKSRASTLAPSRRVAGPSANGRGVGKAVDVELSRLRTLFKEVVEAYATKIEAEIAQVCEEVREQAPQSRKEALQSMLASLRQLKVKPEKGRLRDLKRIHELVRAVRSLAEGW